MNHLPEFQQPTEWELRPDAPTWVTCDCGWEGQGDTLTDAETEHGHHLERVGVIPARAEDDQ